MATGEQKWSSRGEKVKRFSSNPIPKGTYPLELLGEGIEVKKSKSDPDNSVPRIGVRFAAHGTAKEGQKDQLYFHDFYLSLKPGKDGVAMPNRGGQLIEYARANGDELDDIDLEEMDVTDSNGDVQTVRYLSPTQVMEYLESKVGQVHDGKLTIEADTAQADEPSKGLKKGDKYPINDEHPGRNKLQNWAVDEAALQGEQAEEEEAAPAKPAAKVTALPTKNKAPAAPAKKVAGKK